ncbi:hypothetical protein LTR36_005985 [Oleoguttula mirabilis]|uniref:Uncharacterized protein n=1 Tax=Oleoguttula mirabilis TaxID=1507867 RepID=A0AAV9JDE8_9PEZI|nr:hypothetical protein LTR36_005985 [Oleoguttula mirabilis]
MDTLLIVIAMLSVQVLAVEPGEQQNYVEEDFVGAHEGPPELDEQAAGVEGEGAEGEGGELVGQ